MDYTYGIYVVWRIPVVGDFNVTSTSNLGRRHVKVIDPYDERPFVGFPQEQRRPLVLFVRRSHQLRYHPVLHQDYARGLLDYRAVVHRWSLPHLAPPGVEDHPFLRHSQWREP